MAHYQHCAHCYDPETEHVSEDTMLWCRTHSGHPQPCEEPGCTEGRKRVKDAA